MSARDKINLIDEKLLGLEKVTQNVHYEERKLHEERADLITLLLKEENLFSNTSWKIIDFCEYLTIKYLGYSRDEQFTEISKLIETSYHCSFTLDQGITIRFDDGNVCITFDNLNIGIDFINNYNLSIDKSEVTTIFDDSIKKTHMAILILNSIK